MYIIVGISEGFRVGCRPLATLQASSHNLPAASNHKEVVTDYLMKECSLGRIVKPVGSEAHKVHTSPFGVIPKKSSGKWRLIVDLSSPRGKSVNDAIDEELASLSYVSVDNVLEAIVTLGGEAFLGKGDIKEAYRQIPIHPEDAGLLGMQWEGQIYMDLRLPFGLRSAPKIFSAVADTFQWVLLARGVFHYVDDFVIVGRTKGECKRALDVMEETAEELGIQTEPSKREGPSRILTFLGVELDLDRLEVRLPHVKVDELRCMLAL